MLCLRILIVDDEKHVINAIRLLIPTKMLGISEILTAQSCAAAKVILDREKPEIAIVDIIMQKETGISLMTYAACNHLKTRFIVVSGHSDYEYVRTTLLGGAVDYLLKPVESNALINSIQKAQKMIDKEGGKTKKAEMASSLRSNQYVRALLRRILHNCEDKTTLEELDSLLGLKDTLSSCVLMYYDTGYMPMNNTAFAQHLTMFESKIRELFSVAQCGFFMDGFQQPQDRLILMRDIPKHIRQLETTAVSAFKTTGLEFCMGMARCDAFPQDFAEGIERARTAFFQTDTAAIPEVLQRYRDVPERLAKPISAQKERRLLSSIILHDTEQISAFANHWIEESLGEAPTMGTIRSIVEGYAALYARLVERIRGKYPGFQDEASHQIAYISFLDEYFRISGPMMVEAVYQSLQGLSDRFTMFSAEEESFLRIAFYMELNFDAPLNQAEYARLFHVHKDYLSRRFKHVFGEGMINYMNRIRISHAEKLMRETELKIREIAYLTGFDDEKYFSRQFKRFTQLTPSEYRTTLKDGQAS